ncbi:flagellar basal-body rod protein FlgF [Lacimicrobium alkaliphilum]|uniref:Flagellar basal-body rod protein FlgF n=1 Tax=Lacimicrobium alkaliphilum TaxID=1526571 RepID=A0ABQ1RM69_9ALTE|nr:flagellar basal-body rod protein FlgF [Lacimicrobium alkaliphilum]GGD72236.1 flagellar basal-body rod protein FlgF [Lacimicrobium alkaliphilum]
MDKLLYIAASGAKQDLLGTAVRANNLANAQTTGFKAQLQQARAMPAFGEGMPSRVFAMTESPSHKYENGAMIQTGRELDVAIQGRGWLSVQDAQGNEAYTRAGNLQVGADGLLEDGHGNLVIGDAGPIALPLPLSKIDIAADGTLSIRPQGAPAEVLAEVGQLKLVNPQLDQMQKGTDGLFRLKDGTAAAQDIDVRLMNGMLEGSNVNPIEEMVSMIELQRHYELQVKMMKKADELDMRGNMLLRII